MQPITSKRFYSPPFSALASVSVRRYAWALGKPMSEAVDHMVQLLPKMVDRNNVCLVCKDPSRCSSCTFSGQQAADPETAAK